MLVGLIVLSLVLLSISFSEADSGPLHSIQRGISAVFSPIEEGASRALKPARDLVNWFDETFDARGENDELRAEVQELRAQVAEAQDAVGENKELSALLDLDRSVDVIASYDPVTGRVIGRSPTVWYATVTIDVGSGEGVEVNDPVITGDGLVGRVTEVTRGSSQVTLITDHTSAVSAALLPDGPNGVLEPEAGDPDDLLLDFIDNDEPIEEGDRLITAGWESVRISSAYPRGIPLGEVTQATLGEQGSFQQVHVRPYADLRDLDIIQVLTGGPDRPGVPG